MNKEKKKILKRDLVPTEIVAIISVSFFLSEMYLVKRVCMFTKCVCVCVCVWKKGGGRSRESIRCVIDKPAGRQSVRPGVSGVKKFFQVLFPQQRGEGRKIRRKRQRENREIDRET